MYIHHINVLCLYKHSTLMELKWKVMVEAEHQPEHKGGVGGQGAGAAGALPPCHHLGLPGQQGSMSHHGGTPW